MKSIVAIYLSFLLAAPFDLAAQQARISTASSRDPHQIFRFNELPSPDYYSRDFVLAGLSPVQDETNQDSDEVIRNDPQTQRGCLARWIKAGQIAGTITKPTIVTAVGGSGEVVKITLKPGEAIIYDESTKAILAITRCCNKVIDGQLELAALERKPPEFQIVEKPVFVEKPQYQVVEKPVFVERPPVGRPPQETLIVPPKEPEAHKHHRWFWPVIIGAVAAGVITAVILTRPPTPHKSYPSEGVISPP